MSQGELGVIHPRGEFGPSIDVAILNNKDSLDLSFEEAIGYLHDRELDFYHSIFKDVNDLPTFLERIRELFNTNENDKQIFKQFSNVKLKRLLPDIKPPVFERGYELIITGDSGLIDFSILNSEVVKVNGNGKYYISVIPENAQVIKQMLNQGLNRKQGINTFEDSDRITKNLENILKVGESGTKNIGGVFTVQVSKTPVKKTSKVFDVVKFASKKNGQGYWTKKELEELRKNPSSPEAQQAAREVQKANDYIKGFLFKNYFNASKKMQDAMNDAWNSIMGSKDALANSFFFEGENYTKIVLGQIGEFANLVFDNYLKLNSNSDFPPKLIQIIGSDFAEDGKQYHSDLEILLACGASVNQQTKNIGEYKPIPVNTSAALVEPIFGQEAISPLVNYFAAKDYASQHSGLLDTFKEIFEQNFYAAMNLNVSADLSSVARQMNTFYFIGGMNLVPGSEILKTLKQRQDNGGGPSFHISGGNVASYTEEEYEKKYKKHYIWKYPDGGERLGENMIPSSYNAPLYEKDAASISIQTSFSIPKLLASKSFRIF